VYRAVTRVKASTHFEVVHPYPDDLKVLSYVQLLAFYIQCEALIKKELSDTMWIFV
jgi:hypothetical protein